MMEDFTSKANKRKFGLIYYLDDNSCINSKHRRGGRGYIKIKYDIHRCGRPTIHIHPLIYTNALLVAFLFAVAFNNDYQSLGDWISSILSVIVALFIPASVIFEFQYAKRNAPSFHSNETPSSA
jgi:hypothetical protein